MYCPRCLLYYSTSRMECSECGFELTSDDASILTSPCDEMVVLFEGHLQDAEVAQAVVENAGIVSCIMNRRRRGAPVHQGLSQLQVRAEDEDAAKEALAEPQS